MTITIESIRADLARCRNAQRPPNVFGASSHGFHVFAPLSMPEVAGFEKHHKIKLPDGYRRFVTEIGNGGAGPFYGIFKLGEMDDSFDDKQWKENDGFIGILSEPFPHDEAWNDLPPFPEEQDDENAYEAELDAFDKIYWNPKQVNGAIPICHQGCAHRNWLVVTGPEAGNVWEDLRSDQKGLLPAKSKHRSRLTFLEWYDDWLQQAVAKLSMS